MRSIGSLASAVAAGSAGMTPAAHSARADADLKKSLRVGWSLIVLLSVSEMPFDLTVTPRRADAGAGALPRAPPEHSANSSARAVWDSPQPVVGLARPECAAQARSLSRFRRPLLFSPSEGFTSFLNSSPEVCA